jgi:hypothetical protein
MELRLQKRRVKLCDLKRGKLFMHNDTLGMKTEYSTEHGAIEAYIVDSGCMFWGGTDLPKVQRNLLVYPVDVIDPKKELNKQVRKDYKEWKKGN